jgi:organic hydroperoxide reductase OsmC/OhrA
MEEISTQTRHRSFIYTTDLGSIGQRAGILSSPGKQEIRVSSPPEFKGEDGVWTPEHFFVAAVDSCTMMTFLALARRQGLVVMKYSSQATGVLEFLEGKYSFSKVTLEPHIFVEHIEDIRKAKDLLNEAHRTCLIANSIRSEVTIEPTVQWIP